VNRSIVCDARRPMDGDGDGRVCGAEIARLAGCNVSRS
jgi:hypothetical protein